MKAFFFVFVPLFLISCGKSTSNKDVPAPQATVAPSPGPDLTLVFPDSSVQAPRYGAIVGCVSGISPEDPSNIETTRWKVQIGCSATVVEASGSTELDSVLKEKIEEKCPDEVFEVRTVGRLVYKCSMNPNPPFVFTSNVKSEAEKYTHTGENCSAQIAQMAFPDVKCVKQSPR